MTNPDILAAAREAVALGEKATPGPWEIIHYDHGGGRFWVESDGGGRNLVADLYHEGDREYLTHAGAHYAAIAAALLAAEAECERLRGVERAAAALLVAPPPPEPRPDENKR